MKRALYIFRAVDRYLPAMMFALMLSLQGILSAGVADSLVYPELMGPDGRALSFADLCNTLGEDGDAADHCKDCSLHAGPALPAADTVSFCGTEPGLTGLPQPARVLPDTPERWQYFRRGPPHT